MAELDNVLKRYVNGETGSVGALQGAALIVKDRNGVPVNYRLWSVQSV